MTTETRKDPKRMEREELVAEWRAHYENNPDFGNKSVLAPPLDPYQLIQEVRRAREFPRGWHN
jgi:hypothetical protein